MVETIHTQKHPEALNKLGHREFNLYYGDRHLKLCVNPHTNHAYTYIESMVSRPHIEGATTVLYERAHSIMDEITQANGTSVTYSFQTNLNSMRGWALDPNKGARIFIWDYIVDFPNYFTAVKVITPPA